MFEAKINSDIYNRIINGTKLFLPKVENANRPLYNFIRLDFDAETQTVTAIAVDGYRLSVEHAVIADCPESFTVYVKPKLTFPKNKWLHFTADKESVTIQCGDFSIGYTWPQRGEFLNWRSVLPQDKPLYRIGFNADYLLQALQSAKASNGGAILDPVVLEFRDPRSPAMMKTGKDNVKMILPIRIGEDYE